MYDFFENILPVVLWVGGIGFSIWIIWMIYSLSKNKKALQPFEAKEAEAANQVERRHQMADTNRKKYMPYYLKALDEAGIKDKSNVVSLQRLRSGTRTKLHVTSIESYSYKQSVAESIDINNSSIWDNPSQFYMWRDSSNNLCLFPCGMSGNAERPKDSRLTTQLAELDEDELINALKVTNIPLSKIIRFVESGSQFKTSYEVETMRSKVDRQIASTEAHKANKGGNNAAKGAVIGGVVGGVPGAIVGSVIGANSQNNRPTTNIPAPRYNTGSMSHDNRVVKLFTKDASGNEVVLLFKSAKWPGTSYVSDDNMPDEVKYDEVVPFEEIFNRLIPEKHARLN